MNDEQDKKLAALEALLFVHGEPVSFQKIGKIMDIGVEEAEQLVQKLESVLTSPVSGLRILRDIEKAQIVTKPEFGGILEQFIKEELDENLTPASLETLSIVAYFGPISRSRLEYLRGVNSVFTLRNLLLRGLVERFPDPHRTNAFLYKPSFELLKHLGLGGVQELPDYEKFQSVFQNFQTNQNPTNLAA